MHADVGLQFCLWSFVLYLEYYFGGRVEATITCLIFASILEMDQIEGIDS